MVPTNRASQTETTAAPQQWAPRFALGWALLVYAIAVLALGYPALGGGFLVNPHSDQFIAGFAFREFTADHLRTTGAFPQWNPYLYGGMPYVAAMHGDIFYPTFLLRMVLPTDVAVTWSFILHVFLAGGFTYVFLRACGLGFLAAVAGGLAFAIGGMSPDWCLRGMMGSCIGIELPTGGRNVVLAFDSAPYHTGKTVTLVALAAGAVWWLLGAFTERKRRV